MLTLMQGCGAVMGRVTRRTLAQTATLRGPCPLLRWSPNQITPSSSDPKSTDTYPPHDPHFQSAGLRASPHVRPPHPSLSTPLSPSNICPPRSGHGGPQLWLYLEEARCHGAGCHCVIGGHAPHHGAGGRYSALQGWRREFISCPRVPSSLHGPVSEPGPSDSLSTHGRWPGGLLERELLCPQAPPATWPPWMHWVSYSKGSAFFLHLRQWRWSGPSQAEPTAQKSGNPNP